MLTAFAGVVSAGMVKKCAFQTGQTWLKPLTLAQRQPRCR
jgi:hypothetical protein